MSYKAGLPANGELRSAGQAKACPTRQDCLPTASFARLDKLKHVLQGIADGTYFRGPATLRRAHCQATA